MRSMAAASGMVKSLGAFDLILLGIGCVIGTGIFVLTGVAAAKYAGPAVVISFIISGLACALAGLAGAKQTSGASADDDGIKKRDRLHGV